MENKCNSSQKFYKLKKGQQLVVPIQQHQVVVQEAELLGMLSSELASSLVINGRHFTKNTLTRN